VLSFHLFGEGRGVLRGFPIANEDVRCLWGGALVVVTLAHSSGVRGLAEGFGVLSVLFSP